MNEPEVWRQDVPEEKQAVVERAFDTATRGISSFLDHARFGRSSRRGRGAAVQGHDEPESKHGGAIRVFTQSARPGSVGENGHRAAGAESSSTTGRPTGAVPPVIFGAYYAPGSVSDVDQFVGRNAARARWDPFCRSAEVKERHNHACVVVRQEFYPRLLFSGREQWLICAGRRRRTVGRSSSRLRCRTRGFRRRRSTSCARTRCSARTTSCPARTTAPRTTRRRRSDAAPTRARSSRSWRLDSPTRRAGTRRLAPEPLDGSAFALDRVNAALCPSTALVSVAQIDLRNGMPRWFYYLVAVQFARVMRNFRRGIVLSKDDERWWDSGSDGGSSRGSDGDDKRS